MRHLIILSVLIVSSNAEGLCQAAQIDVQAIREGFATPPASARPRVWWHWMNGNITRDGIKKDLIWMSKTGIGGFQNFDASLFTPQVVKDRLTYMTPPWKDAFKHAARLADSLKLEMAIAGSPGWSVTGGPWVPAADGMKKYVWTETQVTGGKTFNGKLPKPPDATGKFQNNKLESSVALGSGQAGIPSYYEDVAIIAFKRTSADNALAQLNPKVSSSGGTFTLTELTNGDLSDAKHLPPGAVGEEIWIQYEFSTPQTFKAFAIAGANHVPLEDFNGGPENRSLKVSDDGVNFREVAKVSGSIVPHNTVGIQPATGKYFRLVYKTLAINQNPFGAMFGGGQSDAKPTGIDVSEFVLYTTDRVHQFEDKAGFTPWREATEIYSQSYTDKESITEVIDLTSKMKADGTLSWNAPAGNWSVLRFGFSLTGRQNHPASPEATGLEVDKLDGEAVARYMETYLDMYKDAAGSIGGNSGLTHMILDSYEAGHMTWTKSLPAEFKKRRGYDITKWIPVLTGRVIDSGESSEKFLWDFRKTISELIAENHYDKIGDILHQRGMKRYTESHEGGRIYLADGMDVKKNSDIPMSAMWTPGSLAPGPDEEVRSRADIRESASVAHIYGQNIVAAESMTAVRNSFGYWPGNLKRTADMEMASGVNRFVIHTSVHQPADDKMPGLSLGPFGQWFTRQETWAEQASSWIDYLARSSWVLQQGKQVADILYYYGENNNITQLCTQSLPKLPTGYEFDFVNASALINVIQAKDGKLVTPSGMSYSVLVLDESAKLMTLPVLRKIRDLKKAGVKIAGTKPQRSPSLSDNTNEFQTIVTEVWGTGAGENAEAILKGLGIQQDVSVTGSKAEILYVHRRDGDRDYYWLNNRSDQATDAEISFRVAGKVPELWNPVTGQVDRVTYQIKDGRTTVPVRFDSWDTYFVVFNDNASAQSWQKPAVTEKPFQTINGKWTVEFQQGRGAPASAEYTTLKSLSEDTNPGIKYFSGTAAYKTSFNSIVAVTGTIDLGEVHNIAEVFLNGKSQGIVWKKPYKLVLKDPLVRGTNTLEVRVTNLWINRLIGDAQPNATSKITFTTIPFYNEKSALVPSGLVGPVVINSISK